MVWDRLRVNSLQVIAAAALVVQVYLSTQVDPALMVDPMLLSAYLVQVSSHLDSRD